MLSSPFACGIARPGPVVSRPTAAIRLTILTVLWYILAVVVAQKLPYIPTTILLPRANPLSPQQNTISDVAYILSPRDDSSVDLLALNISSTVKASSVSLQTLSSGVPFIISNSTAFAPAIAENGSIIAYAGRCSSPFNSGIWTFNPRNGDESAWVQDALDLSSSSVQAGPAFLGASLSFSTTLAPVTSQADIYIYGGMCPTPTNSSNNTYSSESSPQSVATYSDTMFKLSKSVADTSSYSIQQVASKVSTVKEAGFTFTGLTPSISNRSGTITQQINYVVVGGHTVVDPQAEPVFVNMSTAAIWSLPEESWAFVDLSMPGSSTGQTELAIKSTSESVDSRSGHTTVLSEDGSALIVLGGWVGTPPQAASPQLAVLEIGAEYGGSGNWQWSIPEAQPSGPGIYGHGATLLPGNVMMVYGGYNISSSESQSKKRQTTNPNSNAPRFLNLTSMSWSDDYVNPAYSATNGGSALTSPNESENESKKSLGLGLGLGLGLAAVFGALGLFFCYRKSSKRRYEAREETIRALAQDNGRFFSHHEAMMEHDSSDPYAWYNGGHDPYMGGGPSHSLGYESLRNGRRSLDGSRNVQGNMQFMDMSRRSMAPRAAKGQYQPTPTSYDPPSGNRGRGAGVIHPIAEADEDTESHHANEPQTPTRDTNRDSAHYSDPFQTPTNERPSSFPLASQGPVPELQPQATDPEVQDWMEDVDAADALLSSRNAARNSAGAGRLSPTRRGTVKSNRSSGYNADDDGRTDSNISESNRSNFSRSGSFRSHLRTGFGLGTATVAAEAAKEGREGTSSSDSSAPSFDTAKSSFPALQAEGPSLLMGKNQEDDDDDPPGSPSKAKPRRGWLGSLRRVFSGPNSSPSPPESEREGSPVHDSMGEASDFNPRFGGLGSIAAGGLLKRRGGRTAWDAEASRGEGVAAGYDDDDDDEWDVEKAVEKRLVQVMFTVPKERLRVVNGEPDIESGKDVVVVDPEKDDLSDEYEKLAMPDEDDDDDDDEFSHHRSRGLLSEDPEKEAIRAEEARLDKGKQREMRVTVDSGLGTEIASPSEVHLSRASEDLLAAPNSPDVISLDRQLSGFSQLSEGHILDAEAVRLERPRTKVLAMVENIESRSRSASPDRPGRSP